MAKKNDSKKTALYAVVKVDVCGDVSAPGEYIVVTITQKFAEQLHLAKDLFARHKFITEIESEDIPSYAFINDLEWMPAAARKALKTANCVLVQCEPTVFLDLAEDYEDDANRYQVGSTHVNFIQNGFQLVERMDTETCGDEVFITCDNPSAMKVFVG
jgi:hypothetical protein